MNVKLGVVRFPSISPSHLMQGDSRTKAASYHLPIRGIRRAPAPPCFFLHGRIFKVILIAFPYYPISASGTLNTGIRSNKRSLVD